MSEALILKIARFALIKMRQKLGTSSSVEFGDMSFWISDKEKTQFFLVRCDNFFKLKDIYNEKGQKIIHAG